MTDILPQNNNGYKEEAAKRAEVSVETYHWSVHIPEGSFLTVKNFPLNFVSLFIHSEEERRKEKDQLVFRSFFFSTDRHSRAYEHQLDIKEGVLIKDGDGVCLI